MLFRLDRQSLDRQGKNRELRDTRFLSREMTLPTYKQSTNKETCDNNSSQLLILHPARRGVSRFC